MGKQFVIGEFPAVVGGGNGTTYIPDRGTLVVPQTVRFRFAKPPDIDTALAEQILGVVGAVVPTESAPCSDSANFRPRKIVFIRNSGGSFSVAVSRVGNIVANARDIAALVPPEDPVVCMKLVGEEWVNIIDELRTLTTPATPGVPSRIPATAGTKYDLYSGRIPYITDATAGNVVYLPVKVETDVPNAPPTILGGSWQGCVGAFSNVFSCGGGNPREHRRYIATMLITDPIKPSQVTEIPVRSNDTGEILECGQAIANLTSTICLGYKGESNNRLHRFLAPQDGGTP